MEENNKGIKPKQCINLENVDSHSEDIRFGSTNQQEEQKYFFKNKKLSKFEKRKTLKCVIRYGKSGFDFKEKRRTNSS